MTKNNEKEKGGIFYGRFEKEAGEKAEVEQGRYGVNHTGISNCSLVYTVLVFAHVWYCDCI